MNSDTMEKARRARDRLAAGLLDKAGVTLIDIGLDPESKPGAEPERIVLRVHIRPSAKGKVDIPQEVDGIPVKVMIGDFKPD